MQARNLDQQLKAEGQKIMKRLKQLQNSQKWIKNGEQPCLLYKMEIDGRIAAKGVYVCEFSIETIVQFLKKEQSLGKLNPMLKEIKLLHQKEYPDIHYKIIHMEFKGQWPVNGRDFVNVAIGFKQSENKVYVGTKAFDYPVPQKSNVVRGQIYLGAYIIQKLDQTHTKVTYISDSDLKGSIPAFLKNALSVYQGLIAHRVAIAIAQQRSN